jgi:hypothetical protein
MPSHHLARLPYELSTIDDESTDQTAHGAGGLS